MDKRAARFDGWRIDFEAGEISKDGRTHRLQDQPLQILDELLKRPGEVVTREQLIARLWPTGVVEFDTGLNSAIRKLRAALGDDAETPRYIETLPRRGYRFVGTLEADPALASDPVAAAPAPAHSMDVPAGHASVMPPLPRLPADGGYVPTAFETGPTLGRRASDRRAPLWRLGLGIGSVLLALVLAVIAWRMPGGGGAAKPVDESALPTVVVLPLVDMSIDQNQQALCDGLTEELSNWLAHIPTLRVVARTSAFAFKGQNTDVRTIGKALGATHVLEGSLRRSGTQLRITVQLIAAQTGLHIWSQTFDMPVGDIFLIEDTVSRSVAEALHLELSADTAESWAQRKADTAESLEYYLLGRQRQRRRTAEDNLKAIEYFRRAVEADPSYALALVGLSESLLNGLALNRMPFEDVNAEVEPLINRALANNPKLADAYAVKGWWLTEQYKFDEALPLLQRATQLNPNDSSSHRFLGVLFDRAAEPRQALEHFRTSASLDPRDFISQVFLCQELVDLGDLEAADAACQLAREIDGSNMWGPLATSFVARARGDLPEALKWINEALRLSPSELQLVTSKVELLVSLKRYEEARAVISAVPDDGGFDVTARKGTIVFTEGGADALKHWLATQQDLPGRAGTSEELVELAWLRLMSRDYVGAHAALQHAARLLPLATADLYDASQIRHGYSEALLLACAELRGGGDRAKALQILSGMDAMLAKYQRNGGTHFYSWALQAQSLALQGRTQEAAAALRTAYAKGWRSTNHAENEPYLEGVDLSWIE